MHYDRPVNRLILSFWSCMILSGISKDTLGTVIFLVLAGISLLLDYLQGKNEKIDVENK